MDDPYETLEIGPSATQEHIRAAYKRLAQKAHPDREGGSDERMAALNRAYAVLSDPERRAKWDSTGEDAPVTPMQTRAREVVCMVFLNALEDLPDHADSIAVTRDRIKAGMGAGKAQIATMRRRLARLDKRRKRIVGGLLFADLLNAQREGLLKNIENMETDLEVAKLAIELLKSYSDADDASAVRVREGGFAALGVDGG